ncbi:MAG: hypothetical protein ACR2OJ_04245 [Hyphomicrobiales bacterium]
MFVFKLKIAVLSFVFSACVVLTTVTSIPAYAGSTIYDAQVLRHIKLSGDQRSKVKKIVSKSDAEMAQVFRKHKIDPNAKPDFDKLFAASSDLRAIEKRERKAMKKVLDDKQMKQYKKLMNYTAARVRKAAN